MSSDDDELSETGISDTGEGLPDMSLAESLVGIHEIYNNAQAAGFTKYEALWIIGIMLKGLPMPEWISERLDP